MSCFVQVELLAVRTATRNNKLLALYRFPNQKNQDKPEKLSLICVDAVYWVDADQGKQCFLFIVKI